MPFGTEFSRRNFLAASAAGAAVAAGAKLATAQETEAKPVGFALVGIGSLSMGQLLPAFSKCKLAKPVALVSGSPDKAKAQAERYGIDQKNIYNYENFDTIADNPDVDVVYVVLPNSMHAEYTIRAAKAGKHVLCEKPMATTVEDCQKMIDACNEADRKLMIGYRMRYEPMTQKAIEIVKSGETIGDVKAITAEAGFTIRGQQWRLDKELAGGGPLMDMGIYAVNAARYLTGKEPTEVMAMSYSTPGNELFSEVEETMTMEMRFDNFLATVLTSYGFGCNRFRVYGSRGQLESDPMQNYSGNRLTVSAFRRREPVEYNEVNHFAAEMDHLSECIRNDTEPLTSGAEGMQDVKILTAAYESAKTGKAVKVG